MAKGNPKFIGVEFAVEEDHRDFNFNFSYSMNAAYCQRWITEKINGTTIGKFTRENCNTIGATLTTVSCRCYLDDNEKYDLGMFSSGWIVRPNPLNFSSSGSK